MALELLKLAINASTSIVTSPNVQKFFYVVDGDITGEDTLIIDAANFMDDTGATGVTLPELATDDSYFIVYVNGVQVMQSLLTYTPGGANEGSLDINVPAGSDVTDKSPVVLVVTNFAPTAQTTIRT